MKELYLNERKKKQTNIITTTNNKKKQHNRQILFCPTNLIKNIDAFSDHKSKSDLRCMCCTFLWTLWLYITFSFKREKENDIRNGWIWKLLRCDMSRFYSLLTLTALATCMEYCWGNHRDAGALLEYLQAGSQPWLDFSCHWHLYSGNVS